MQLEEFINSLEERNIRVFSFNDAVRGSGKSRAYVRLALSRMVNRGALRRIERGVYSAEQAGALEIASNILQPSYVSLMAALSYHGVTTQIPIVIEVIAPKRHRPVSLDGGGKVVFMKVKREMMFGFRVENGASIAELEKAFVDALYFRNPGIGEVGEALEAAMRLKKINIGRLKEYAAKTGSHVVKTRLRKLLAGTGSAAD